MGARFGRVIRRLVALIIFPFQFVLRLIGRFLRGLWRGIRWLARGLAALGRRLWAYTGRLGLAFRRMLTLLWRPLAALLAPVRWLYRKTLGPPVNFLWLSLRTFAEWFVGQILRPLGRALVALVRRIGRFFWQTLFKGIIVAFFRRRWQATAPRRIRLRRRWRSRKILWQARLRIAILRPKPPKTIIKAPQLPPPVQPPARINRFATALVTTGLVLILGMLTTQARQAEQASAESAPDAPDASLTVTPTPEQVSTRPAEPTPIFLDPVLLTPWPTPDPLSGGGSVAFTARLNGNSDIFLLTVGQSDPIRLTSHPAEDRDPIWSPDGRQLAFASHRDGNWEIYILDLPSGNLRRLTDDPAFDGAPSWSHDGAWLVYESYQQNNLDLYIIRADGSGPPIRLTENPARDYAPFWSPDGRHIAFTSWRSGNKDIFIMSLDDASDERALNITASPGGFEDHPAFSPDGSYLTYYDTSTGFELVYVVPLENYRPAGQPLTVGQGRHPAWSPNGQNLVYVHSDQKRNFLIASNVDAWSVAPQAFTSSGQLDDLSWSAVTVPPELADYLRSLVPGSSTPLFTEQITEPEEEESAPHLLWEVDVDAPSPYLNDRVDQSFNALRERVIAEVGWDFLARLDNMFLPPDVRPQPGQRLENWNKAGRAFDIYFRYALANEPQIEIVREDRGNETYWRIYLKAAVQDGSQGEPMRDLPWDFEARFGDEPLYYDQGGKWKEAIPDGYYLDFTQLAADYGWLRVPAADNWRTFFPGIYFWHYENRQELTWLAAMAEIYSADELAELLDR